MSISIYIYSHTLEGDKENKIKYPRTGLFGELWNQTQKEGIRDSIST